MLPVFRAALLVSVFGLVCVFLVLLFLVVVCVGFFLPTDGDASVNWRMAGMLSLGGIPNRTTVCATITPLGSGKDDTTAIQSAIDSCPDGEVVSLSAGVFTIAEGNLVLIHKDITLRGAGPGVTVLTRK